MKYIFLDIMINEPGKMQPTPPLITPILSLRPSLVHEFKCRIVVQVFGLRPLIRGRCTNNPARVFCHVLVIRNKRVYKAVLAARRIKNPCFLC